MYEPCVIMNNWIHFPLTFCFNFVIKYIQGYCESFEFELYILFIGFIVLTQLMFRLLYMEDHRTACVYTSNSVISINIKKIQKQI